MPIPRSKTLYINRHLREYLERRGGDASDTFAGSIDALARRYLFLIDECQANSPILTKHEWEIVHVVFADYEFNDPSVDTRVLGSIFRIRVKNETISHKLERIPVSLIQLIGDKLDHITTLEALAIIEEVERHKGLEAVAIETA